MSEEGLKPSSLTGNIELADVKFHYPSRSEIQVIPKSTAIALNKKTLHSRKSGIHSLELAFPIYNRPNGVSWVKVKCRRISY